jgi:hypothetical protein
MEKHTCSSVLGCGDEPLAQSALVHNIYLCLCLVSVPVFVPVPVPVSVSVSVSVSVPVCGVSHEDIDSHRYTRGVSICVHVCMLRLFVCVSDILCACIALPAI